MLANVFTKTIQDRWISAVVGGLSLGLLLWMGMAVYRDIDLGVYTSLPEAMRTLMGIPGDADVTTLAYGAIYSTYGALTLTGIAISVGASTIAGEERDGTIGLLLGNPRSRTQVLVAKAGSLIVITGLGGVLLLSGGYLVPAMLGVELGSTAVGALILHMVVSALFYGFLALALGSWTGNRAVASGATVAVMLLSFVAVGVLPLIERLADAVEFFPWYYYDGSDPIINGVSGSHVAVLGAGIAVFAAIALVGVNRRDLRERSTRESLVDRLRENPTTRRLVDRLAGSARVSRIWVKLASEHQGVLLITAAARFWMMGVMMGPLFAAIDTSLFEALDQFPESVMALIGSSDMSTPEGFYQAETFGLMAPIAVMVVTILVASRGIAGEERRRTMGLLLANPVRRSHVVLQATTTMVVYASVVGLATFAGVATGSLIAGLGMSIPNIAATSMLATLVGLVFGALALAVGAGTGQSRLATYGSIGAALVLYVLNAFLPLAESTAPLAKWQPFHYYLSSDPLNNGMPWGHAALLLGLAVALIGAAVWLFERRDVRDG